MHSVRSQRPVVALDVDGVLFPLGKNLGDPLPQPEGWIHTSAGHLPVSYDPALPEWLTEISKLADIVWATSWDDLANKHISPMLNIGELPTLDITSDRWTAVNEYALNRPLVWCEDRVQSTNVKTTIKNRNPRAILIQPKREQGLTTNQRQRILNWLKEQTT